MAGSLEKILREALEPFLYRFILIPQANRGHKRRIRVIRDRGTARVAFIMSSLPMWRFQGLYDLLKQDSRFQLLQAIYPFPTYTEEQKVSSVKQILDYCEERGMPVINLSSERNPGTTLKEGFNPDIVFYPQPYNDLFLNDLDNQFFSDRLICYIPYAMLTAKESWAYKNRLNNIAWRVFFQSSIRKEEAVKVLYNAGRNIRVTGEPLADLFNGAADKDVWKKQDTLKKRVIWAPHFSITEGGYLHRDSFTWLSETMREIARQYQDRIQFAFKPHPRLKSVLYELPDWGKDRTDAYYESWENGSNTQLETGNYIDLFKTSDAMVHDCSSFSVEYHFTEKPVLFLSSDLSGVLDKLNDFGREAILVHYQGQTKEDILSFLEDIVLSGNDPRVDERRHFKEKYLSKPGSRSVAENIYYDLLTSLGFER